MPSALVRKNRQVILHVRNFNDYLYTLEVDQAGEQFTVPAGGAGGLFSAVGGQGALSSLKEAASSFSVPGFNMAPALSSGEDDRSGFGSTGAEGSRSDQMQRQFSSYEQVLTTMQSMERELSSLGKDIEADLQIQETNSYLKDELQKLRTHPTLPPQKIKKLSMEYMARILDTSPGADYNLEDLLDRANIENSIGRKVDDYQQDVSLLNDELTRLNGIKNIILALDELDKADSLDLANNYQQVQNRMQRYQNKIEQMQTALPQLKEWDVRELAAIRYLYEEMQEHQFEESYRFTTTEDVHTLSIKLIPTDSARIGGATTRKLNAIRVPVYGGLKVNASVGLSFAGFFERPQDYFVQNGLIVGDDLDPFLPIVTSFVHFYPQSKRTVSVGGSFGLGVGIGGDNAGLQNYFFGPSLIMGKGQRIVLSSGLMGGKVERLSQGLQIGDAYDQTVIPTKSIYELGFFLGISFNILGQ